MNMPDIMPMPTLYKKTSTGAIQEWTIRTEDNVIVTTYGQHGGKMQTARDVITEGKNHGKKNATDPSEQARLETISQWEKKKKKGYVESVAAASAGEVDALVEGGIFPMLAKTYADHGDKMVYPAYVQPKLDGHRCIAVKQGEKVTLWSRTRKRITGVPHIERALESLLVGHPDVNLDGELYNHDYRDNFEDLTSFIRQEVPVPGHEAVQYHIYDIVDETKTFEERQVALSGLRDAVYHPPAIRYVTTLRVSSEEEMYDTYTTFRTQGYEGLMVRSATGKYKINGRSADLLKVKEFVDTEFEVIGVTEGRGKMAGKAMFTCRMTDGGEFECKMKGSLDALRQYIEHPDRAIGRQLTVQYQGLTKYGKPRFPVGVRFRQDV
jgi:DNA ligase 1